MLVLNWHKFKVGEYRGRAGRGEAVRGEPQAAAAVARRVGRGRARAAGGGGMQAMRRAGGGDAVLAPRWRR